MIRTLIVEDGALARAGLLRLLARHEDVDVVGEVATIADAIMQVAALRPDLAILDIERNRVGAGSGTKSPASDHFPHCVS